VQKRPERLVVLASILVDVIVWVDRMPERGGDLLARRGEATPGGAFNVIAAAKRLDMKTAYGGIIGLGPFGTIVRHALKSLDVDTLFDREGPCEDTGFDVTVVERDGERTFITAPGAEAKLDAAHLAAISLQPTDAVYLSGYDLAYPVSGPPLATWVHRIGPGPLVFLDPGPLVSDIPAERMDEILARVDILSLSEREASLLSGASTTPQQMIDALLGRLGEHATVVLRQGADGAVVGQRGRRALHIPTRRVSAVDTTGAGDVHGAAFLARLARGRTLEEAVRDANAAASFAVTYEGPAVSPTTDELEAILANW